jgi:hypothetical protein
MSDKDLENQIKTFSELGKENPNVDVNMLMMNALQNENAKKTSSKSYRWPYLISIGLPPFGLLFAAKYYWNGDEEDKHAANICVILTILSIVVVYIFGKMMFSTSGTSLEQIQQIKPQDIQQLYQ